MIYYDPKLNRLRDSDSGKFVSGAADFLEVLFGEEYEEELEDLFLFYKPEKKPRNKKKERKEKPIKEGSVNKRLEKILKDYAELMEEPARS